MKSQRRKPHTARLTDAHVAKHSNRDGSTPFLWDDGKGSVAGFGVRATESGGRQYTLRYRHEGRQRSLSLGPVERFESVEAARVKAREMLGQRVKGIDPAIGGDGTLRSVWQHYIDGLRTGRDRLKDKGKPASDKTISAAQSAWSTHFENSIGDLPPKRLTAAKVRDLHAAISAPRRVVVEGRGGNVKRGGLYAANRALTYLQSAWRLSAVDGLTRDLPDPFEKLRRNTETARAAYLKKADAPAFFTAVNAEPADYRAYWLLSILVGARGGELRSLRWEDVRSGTITFRDTKNGSDREVALPPDAVRVLAELPRAGRLVFPFTYPNTSWKRVLKRAGLTGLRPHDVRRTVGSWLGAAGLTSGQVGALLGHKSDITSRVYIRLADDAETKASAAATQADLVRQYSNVVPFPAPAKPATRRRA